MVAEENTGSSVERTYELVRPDGSTRRFGPAESLELSPDRRWIAQGVGDRGLLLFDVARDTEEPRAFDAPRGAFDRSGFVWSPDGRKLAFILTLQDGKQLPTFARLFVHDLATGQTSRFDVEAFLGCGATCSSPAPLWSPKGDLLAVRESNRKASGGEGEPKEWIALYRPAGTRLAKTYPAEEPWELLRWDAKGIHYRDRLHKERLLRVGRP